MKKIIIMQGVPGSGKSTWAKEEAARTGGTIVSADHWFERSGEYRFDPSQLGQAHAACFRAFLERLHAWKGQINGTLIVDNTNTRPAELSPYFLAASALAPDADVFVLRVLCDPEVAAARCTHGVPLFRIQAMDKAIHSTSHEYLPSWKVRVLGKEDV